MGLDRRVNLSPTCPSHDCIRLCKSEDKVVTALFTAFSTVPFMFSSRNCCCAASWAQHNISHSFLCRALHHSLVTSSSFLLLLLFSTTAAGLRFLDVHPIA